MDKSEALKSVFLSSTTRDLIEYRKAVYEAINRMDGYHCVRMEDFGARNSLTADFCQKQVIKCKLFVGITGLCYGIKPRGAKKSYTELEYEAALSGNLPRLMFVAPEDFSVPANILHKDGHWEEQQSFRRRIKEELIRDTFYDPSELANKVVIAIRNWEKREGPNLNTQVDCIILCGGYAKRLWPLTRDLSKVLLPIAGQPCVDYTVEQVMRVSNLRKTLLLVNEKLAPQIENYAKSYKFTNTEVLTEPHIGEEQKWGPAEALNFIVTHHHSQDYLVIAGDNLFKFDLNKFLQFAWSKDATCIAIHKYESQEDASEYGAVKLAENGSITEFREKEKFTEYREISTAVYYLRREELMMLTEYLESDGLGKSFGSFFHWLQTRGVRVVGYAFNSPWFDIGTRRKFIDASRHYLKNRNDGVLKNGAVLDGVVQIERGAIINNSRVGPSVYIGADSIIENSEIKNSVIMDKSEITNSSISNSLIGERSKIEGDISEMVCGPHTRLISPHRFT